MRRRTFLLAATALGAALALPAHSVPPASWRKNGGRGGRIIRVTTLAHDGPGSITEAVKAKGARIIVFEVGGVIDLSGTTLRISNPDITIAGQTAPAPGITFIRGGLAISEGCSNVVIQHIAVRPGEAGHAKKSGWECDGIYAYGASEVEISNCSISWATDEGLSASGPRFDGGETVDAWRSHTSRNIVFASNIVAEGLSNSTHSKGEHSKGTLIHDNVTGVQIMSSLYAHNMERNVLFKGGAQGVVNNNVVYNAGKRFSHYNLHEKEWEGHAFQAGQMLLVNNVYIAGPSTDAKAAAFMLGGEGDLDIDFHDNLGLGRDGALLPMFGRFGSGKSSLVEKQRTQPQFQQSPQAEGQRRDMEHVLASCGARPWDRDPIDARIVADVRNGTGKIIDSEQDVGGYPVRPETHEAFREADWNLDTMERR